MKLGEKDAQMPMIGNCLLKERCLVLKILLLTEELCHAVLDWANGGALGLHPSDVEAMFLECLLQPLCFPILECHLWHSMILGIRVAHWYYCPSVSIASLHWTCSCQRCTTHLAPGMCGQMTDQK